MQTTLSTFNQSLNACKQAFYFSLLFSLISNLMMLAVPMYSLQVLDRVVSSGSLTTLLMLTLVVLLALACLSLMQVVRSALLIRLGNWLEQRLAPMLFQHAIATNATQQEYSARQPLQDLAALKAFLTGAAINALLDLPWSLIFIIILVFIHPAVGLLAIIGAIVLLVVAVANEIKTKPLLNLANEANLRSMHYTDSAARNADVIAAMGMLNAIASQWHQHADQGLSLQSQASRRAAWFAGLTRFLRLSIQIAVTGVGAYFVLHNQMTVGAMIASGILVGRALAPFENTITSWKSFVSARKALARLRTALSKEQARPDSITLPAPSGAISVDNLFYAAKHSSKAILKGISFNLNPGEILVVLGPSAAGKSTLAKLLTGVWRPNAGHIRLDEADVYAWQREQFGKYVGYLPQDIELFAGSVKQNIARMASDLDDEAVVAAAQSACAHDLILHFSQGYETEIGLQCQVLSAGQRQRVALARAFYGQPKLLVLDEPNASLDEAGERALNQAIQHARAAQITTVIISHRPAILQQADKVLILQDGQVVKFGERDEVINALKHAHTKQGLRIS